MSEAQVEAFLTTLNRVLSRLDSFPIPTIAAIDGPALGGGLELALTCDFRIAGEPDIVREEQWLTTLSGHNVTKIGFPEVCIFTVLFQPCLTFTRLSSA